MYQRLVRHISQTKPNFGLVFAIYNWSVVTVQDERAQISLYYRKPSHSKTFTITNLCHLSSQRSQGYQLYNTPFVYLENGARISKGHSHCFHCSGARLEARTEREMSNLRARIAKLEHENAAMQTNLFRDNDNDCCSEQVEIPFLKKQRFQNNVSIVMSGQKQSTPVKFEESCNFCSPLRCQSCKKRVSIKIYMTLPLLVNNRNHHSSRQSCRISARSRMRMTHIGEIGHDAHTHR